ncbi:MAG: hypothetical protein F6J89_14475 [Symploca sp. SIO1C4]|uniref:Uncharacterized protein n=1 Tax=Symploca sp. SIO1C4 TaxID=2607765 RepID=A0A6B3NGP3_9CYAN|nr:hypothetical protein [Symploca sp. SIO1C4]NET04657.1 hypothetical protein [Symploca sp. SIO2B6]
MLKIVTLFEFSRANCIAICTFLVPANLVLTSLTLALMGLARSPQLQARVAAVVALLPAVLIMLHVYTWFAVGVVRTPTFILLLLSFICIGINTWGITHANSLVYLVRGLFSALKRVRV